MTDLDKRMGSLEKDHAVTRQQIDDHLTTCQDRYKSFEVELKHNREDHKVLHSEIKGVRKSQSVILISLVVGLIGVIASLVTLVVTGA